MSESSVTSSFSFFQALSKSSSSVDVPTRVNVGKVRGSNVCNKLTRTTSFNSSNNNQNDSTLCSQSDSSKCFKNKPRPRDFPTDFLPSRKLPLSKSTSASSIPPSFTNRPMSALRGNSNRLPNKPLLLNDLPKSSNSRASCIIDSPKYFRFPSSPFDVSFTQALPQGRFNQYFYSVPSTPGYQADNQPSIESVLSTPSLDDPNVHWFRTSKNFSLHYHSPSKAVHISQVDSPNHHNPLRIFNTDASLSECYFAGKGAAVVLAPHDRPPPASIHPQPRPPDIQHHLQSMFYLLRQEETLKMAVKLESVHPGRTRYLVVVSRQGKQMTEESCLLGIDCNHSTTVGLVLKVLADTSITLDGDGGFSVTVAAKTHIFKPVSVQAMWSALQTLHKVSGKARAHNYFLGGVSHEWVGHYEQNVASDRSCLNEWHTMDSIESRRPPSPDSIRHKPVEREETKALIRSSLKEIMMSVDLDDVTSKQVRTKLEESLDVDLAEYKPFIDQEMLVILGQMDEATEIFPHVYLGSEWNASNLEELTKNGVCHILNVTREIDNFFPGMFDYLNIRVYDDEKTDLLKHWDDTFKYITKAKKAGSKVLVHCKMGVSRSASVVIAYAMKAYSWDLKQAIAYVQNKRSCIKPNASFIQQLETYQGMLDAMKNREKLQRSKSETNLKSNGEAMRTAEVCGDSGTEVSGGPSEVLRSKSESEARVPPLHAPPPAPPLPCTLTPHRPKSWSPDHATANNIFTTTNGSAIGVDEGVVPPPPPLPPPPTPPIRSRGVSVWMPCSNGLAYCVSQNKILHLPTVTSGEDGVVKSRVEKLETGKKSDRKGMVLNLKDQFEEDRLQLNSRSFLLKDSLSQKEDHLKEGFSQRDSFSKEVLRQWESQQKDNPNQRDTFVFRDPPSHCNVLTVQDGIIQRIQDASVQQMDLDRPVERRDPFSSQLDRVFDKEETSGSSISRQNSLGSGDRISPEPGIVKSLKREFEAKSKNSGGSSGGSSLPSSPVSERSGQSAAPTASLEDLTSRGIVNRHKPPKAPPPPAAVAVATTVLAKAQKKKLQQGKTHPLARLTYKTRHPNPVYNTM